MSKKSFYSRKLTGMELVVIYAIEFMWLCKPVVQVDHSNRLMVQSWHKVVIANLYKH